MLLSKDAIADVIDIGLHAGDFYRPNHGVIFDAILALSTDGEPADPVTIVARLTEDGTIGRVGGASYIHDLIGAVPAAANAGYYARIVAERSVRRGVVEVGGRITQAGYGAGDTEDVVQQAQQWVYELTKDDGGDDLRLLEFLLQPVMDEVEASSGGNGALTGVPSGFLDLDRLTNGFHPGQLIVIAGRPGMGKSTVGLDIVRSAAFRNRLTTAVFTLEMSNAEIVMKLLSAESKVPLSNLRNGFMSDEDWIKLGRAVGDLSEAPLWIDDGAGLNLMQIRSKARRLKQQHDLKLVVIDYMQLLSSAGKRPENRQQEVSELSRGLKVMAKELEVPVIAISQLNRASEARMDKRPQLSDLRESGSIEQDADMVILLHRDDYYEKECPRAGEADLIVAKHRNGPTETITLAFQGHFSRFVDMSATR
jgi:replicative DNA helicase